MWAVDMRDAQALQRLTQEIGARVVFHLAGKVTARQELGLVADTLGGNLLSTVNILTALAGSKIEKFVLAGSSAEITRDGVPSSPYAASKLASAIYADMFQRLYDVPVVRTRIFTTYGPGQEASKVIPHIINSLLASQPPLLSSATRACDFIFVDDVVTGLLIAARSGQPGGAPIDFGTGQAIMLKDVARELAKLAGRTIEPVFNAVESRRFEAAAVADIDATYELLGWRPAWTLQQGLMKTLEWFEAHESSELTREFVPEKQ
jgi:nucleoside-diphosphate-sugar epimerase